MINSAIDTEFRKKFILIFIISSIAFTIAIIQPFGLSPDYENYQMFFQDAREDFFSLASETRFEVGFVYLGAALAKVLSLDVFVYGTLVFVSVAMKSYFIQKLSFGYFSAIAFLFYFIKIFPLHELTQLRASLSAAFVLGACFCIWGGMRWRGFFMCLLAPLFHYSSLMILPFLYVEKFDRRQAIIFSFCIFVVLFAAIQYLVPVLGGVLPVFQDYENIGYGDEVVNSISPVFWPEFLMILFAVAFWGDLTDVMRRVVVLQLIGFAIFYGAIQFPVIAVRGRELFSVLWVFFIAQGAMSSPRVKMAILIFVFFSIVISVNLFFVRDFFH